MKIKALMASNPITVAPTASVEEAIELMKVNSIRHLPVVSGDLQLKGFVTLSDLKQALIPSMVGNFSIADLMVRDPITAGPDDDVEMAALKIYRHKIGGLPVIQNRKLVGIITESDILGAFIEMMGLLSATSRIDVATGAKPESFKLACELINDNGGDIINVAMTAQPPQHRTYYFRLTACRTAYIRRALEQAGFKVLEAMD